jgi:protein-disulfide isomerase
VIRIVLFTHPICSGCREALAAAEQLRAERPGEVELDVVSLASARGRERAREAGVVVVPTVVVGGARLVGAPTVEELWQLVDDALAATTGGAR